MNTTESNKRQNKTPKGKKFRERLKKTNTDAKVQQMKPMSYFYGQAQWRDVSNCDTFFNVDDGYGRNISVR